MDRFLYNIFKNISLDLFAGICISILIVLFIFWLIKYILNGLYSIGVSLKRMYSALKDKDINPDNIYHVLNSTKKCKSLNLLWDNYYANTLQGNQLQCSLVFNREDVIEVPSGRYTFLRFNYGSSALTIAFTLLGILVGMIRDRQSLSFRFLISDPVIYPLGMILITGFILCGMYFIIDSCVYAFARKQLYKFNTVADKLFTHKTIDTRTTMLHNDLSDIKQLLTASISQNMDLLKQGHQYADISAIETISDNFLKNVSGSLQQQYNRMADVLRVTVDTQAAQRTALVALMNELGSMISQQKKVNIQLQDMADKYKDFD